MLNVIRSKKSTLVIALLLATVVSLSGCNGGGGNTSNNTPGGNTGGDTVTGSSAKTAVLTWEAVTTNDDGTPCTDLAGYRLLVGTSPSNYSSSVDMGMPVCRANGSGVTECTYTYTNSNLSVGTYYFVITSYDSSGNTSTYSNEVTKVIN